MKSYIKPSANVIELAVKERLSRSRVETRTYNVSIGNYTKRERTIPTAIYAAVGASNINLG